MHREREKWRVIAETWLESHTSLQAAITQECSTHLKELGKQGTGLLGYFDGCFSPHEIVDEHRVYVHQVAFGELRERERELK